jgi:hypothetical protein
MAFLTEIGRSSRRSRPPTPTTRRTSPPSRRVLLPGASVLEGDRWVVGIAGLVKRSLTVIAGGAESPAAGPQVC